MSLEPRHFELLREAAGHCDALVDLKQDQVSVLSGGITNINYKLTTASGNYVARIVDPSTELLGIKRENEYACQKAAADLGVAPELFYANSKQQCSITKFVTGKTLDGNQDLSPELIKKIASLIKSYHEAPPFPGKFSPFTMTTDYQKIAVEKGAVVFDELEKAVNIMSDLATALEPHQRSTPCHNDLLPANFIVENEKIWLIDWEYGAMGDPIFDLGNFAANFALTEEQEELFLTNYFTEISDTNRSHFYLMKQSSNMREAMWGFLQARISKLDFDFNNYCREHLEKFLAAANSDVFKMHLSRVRS